jgi:hypothetical protein
VPFSFAHDLHKKRLLALLLGIKKAFPVKEKPRQKATHFLNIDEINTVSKSLNPSP